MSRRNDKTIKAGAAGQSNGSWRGPSTIPLNHHQAHEMEPFLLLSNKSIWFRADTTCLERRGKPWKVIQAPKSDFVTAWHWPCVTSPWLACYASWCFTELLPKLIRRKMKQSRLSRKAFGAIFVFLLMKKMPSPSNKTATRAASMLISLATAMVAFSVVFQSSCFSLFYLPPLIYKVN